MPHLSNPRRRPKNLRVTGVTDWTVALVWDAAKGKGPPRFWGQVIDGATETMVFWGSSQDNVTQAEHTDTTYI